VVEKALGGPAAQDVPTDIYRRHVRNIKKIGPARMRVAGPFVC